MITLDDKYLLMIEPQNPATDPLNDVLTEVARRVFATCKPGNGRWRGWHTCVCGARSDNKDWFLPDGTMTNSLMVHYVECHRDEVPDSELEKLRGAS